MKLKLFFIIYIIQILFAIKDYKKTCNNKNLYNFIIILLHHIIDIYVIFGIIINETIFEQKIHTLFIILVLLQWFILHGCFITKYHNKLCKMENENRGLHSLTFIFSEIIQFDYIHAIIVILQIIYNIKRIYF